MQAARLVGGGDQLPLELGARIELLEQLRVFAHLRLARNSLPLLGLNFRASLVDVPDCACSSSSLEEIAEHAFYYCEQVDPFWDHVRKWTARIEAKQLVPLDVGYLVDNVLRSAVSCLAGYWKFNTSLLLIGDFQDWLESSN